MTAIANADGTVQVPKPRPVGPYAEDGKIGLVYRDESSLRQAIASIADAYGWTVEQEVFIPQWGRIDLVLRERAESSSVYLIELKLDLTKAAKVRKAFQQADGYSRWWTAKRGSNLTYLVAVKSDQELVATVADMYPAIGFRTVRELVGALGPWGNHEHRMQVARARADEVRERLQLHHAALTHLEVLP